MYVIVNYKNEFLHYIGNTTFTISFKGSRRFKTLQEAGDHILRYLTPKDNPVIQLASKFTDDGRQVREPDKYDLWFIWRHSSPRHYACKAYAAPGSTVAPIGAEEAKFTANSVKLKPEEFEDSFEVLEVRYPYVPRAE